MAELMAASRQWASRPDDERYTSLDDMLDDFLLQKSRSREAIVKYGEIESIVSADGDVNVRRIGGEHAYAPTHWSFGQLCSMADAPAPYLRRLPAEKVADLLNYGWGARVNDEVALYLHANGHNTVRAATGPNYGRIHNADVVANVINRYGNGLEGDWRVPGIFGKELTAVTKENTTLYGSDRDMWIFLADERNRIEVPNRRNGKPGSLARGFFLWNSEVGDKSLGMGVFLFDSVCSNRIVWGAREYREIRVRHTAKAPDRWLEDVQPQLLAYANATAEPVNDAIAAAQSSKIDEIDAFLASRFGPKSVEAIKSVHMLEEQRPIETMWDAVTAVTAWARNRKHIDARVMLERAGGDLLKLVAA